MIIIHEGRGGEEASRRFRPSSKWPARSQPPQFPIIVLVVRHHPAHTPTTLARLEVQQESMTASPPKKTLQVFYPAFAPPPSCQVPPAGDFLPGAYSFLLPRCIGSFASLHLNTDLTHLLLIPHSPRVPFIFAPAA